VVEIFLGEIIRQYIFHILFFQCSFRFSKQVFVKQNKSMAEFQHGLFGCFDNCGVCIISYFVPCYTVGKTAEAVGDSCLMCGLGYIFTGCIAGGIIRGKVRAQKGIGGSALGDFCIHFFCPFCAIIQDHNEVLGGPGSAGESIARM